MGTENNKTAGTPEGQKAIDNVITERLTSELKAGITERQKALQDGTNRRVVEEENTSAEKGRRKLPPAVW